MEHISEVLKRTEKEIGFKKELIEKEVFEIQYKYKHDLETIRIDEHLSDYQVESALSFFITNGHEVISVKKVKKEILKVSLIKE